MHLPTKEAATALLHEHVKDDYQRLHALMVATAMEGYAVQFGEDPLLWYVTGLLRTPRHSSRAVAAVVQGLGLSRRVDPRRRIPRLWLSRFHHTPADQARRCVGRMR